jgi:hypothetical protein
MEQWRVMIFGVSFMTQTGLPTFEVVQATYIAYISAQFRNLTTALF